MACSQKGKILSQPLTKKRKKTCTKSTSGKSVTINECVSNPLLRRIIQILLQHTINDSVGEAYKIWICTFWFDDRMSTKFCSGDNGDNLIGQSLSLLPPRFRQKPSSFSSLKTPSHVSQTSWMSLDVLLREFVFTFLTIMAEDVVSPNTLAMDPTNQHCQTSPHLHPFPGHFCGHLCGCHAEHNWHGQRNQCL